MDTVLHGTLEGELPHLRYFRLEGSAFVYVCADQQSGQGLIRVTVNHRLGSVAMLKATDNRKVRQVALRMKDKVPESPDELLKWIKDLNPGLHTEHWRVLDRLHEPKGQRLPKKY
jgi:hypothetical protein